MKNGKSLVELAQEVQRQRETKKDYLADTRMMEMSPGDDGSETLTIQNMPSFGLNDTAHRQIGTFLKIPASYYDKMRMEYPDLLAQNVNAWFRKNPASRMVRTLDGNARAFLSDRYRRIDNAEILESVLPILGELHEQDDVRVESCEVTDKKLYLKVVNPRLQTEVVPGDIVQSGIVISNSEIGLGSVTVQPLVYRLVCSNGMIVNDAATRKYHVGRGNEAGDNYELYSDATIIQDDKAFMMKIQDTVRAISDQTKFEKVVGMMREAKEARITGNDIPKVIELASKEFSITKAEGAGVLDSLIRGGDMSLYGLSNAVTAHAQIVESYDRSTELEMVAFDILTMSRVLWNRINKEAVL